MHFRRTASFAERSHPRYWWFQQFRPKYDPPVFSTLNDQEWSVIDAWFAQSEIDHPNGTGECAIPAISLLHGLITGNNVSRVVQLGHFIGFSTLLLGLTLRRMGFDHALFSIDIDPNVTAYTQGWLEKARLEATVQLKVGDSADRSGPSEAVAYLGDAPSLIFIDSSHQYEHTLKELNLWYPALQPGGFILMHDVSQFAASFDETGQGGVARAAKEWLSTSAAGGLMVNGNLTNQSGSAITYRDGCGLGIIQKPF
jgi:predicted O-methyltransferase YrrM